MDTTSRPASGAGKARRAVRALGAVLVVCAIAIAAYPLASDVAGRIAAQRNFSEAAAQAQEYAPEQVGSQMADASAYNRGLAGALRGQASADGAASDYDTQLTLADNVLCWLDIPRLALKIPVYRGSNDESVVAQRLMEGAVHLWGSSLPVGGASTRAVLTAHSGMRNASMFDDLGVLEPGDRFTLWVYGQPLVYEMQSSEVVEPNEVPSRIGIEAERDLVTLVTCTPYGVNSHRLLVHAQRVKASPPATTVPKMSDALRSPHVLLFAVALAFAIALVCSIALARHRRRSK